MWLDTFNDMRKESGMSLDELSEKSGIPKGTLSKITSGITKAPALETMKSLVYAMGYTLSDLDDETKRVLLSKHENGIIKKYRALDGHGKEMVNIVLEKESARMADEAVQKRTEEPEKASVVYITTEFIQPMSAGTGDPAGEGEWQNLSLTREPPKGTSYVARIHGDSMEPTYYDGDRVFVRSQEELRIGEIGVFFMDGKQWIKELGNRQLISHNPEYDPIDMTEDIRCQGKVLGVCDESYLG